MLSDATGAPLAVGDRIGTITQGQNPVVMVCTVVRLGLVMLTGKVVTAEFTGKPVAPYVRALPKPGAEVRMNAWRAFKLPSQEPPAETQQENSDACHRCFVCGKGLKSVFMDDTPQCFDAVMFCTSGNYGSKVFDSNDDSQLLINVCDSCLTKSGGGVIAVKPIRILRDCEYSVWVPEEDQE